MLIKFRELKNWRLNETLSGESKSIEVNFEQHFVVVDTINH